MKKKTQLYIKKVQILTVLFLLIICTSCEDDNTDTFNPETEEQPTQELLSEVSKFAGTNEQTFKLNNALLSNSEVSNLNVTHLFNLKDDELIFSTEGNGDLKLTWHQGFYFNDQADNLNAVLSDTRASSKIESLTFDEDNFTFTAAQYSFTSIDNVIYGTFSFSGGANLTAELVQKTTEDYLLPPTSLDTVEELFNVTGATVWSGFKGSIAQNKLYLTNFNSPSGNGDQRAFLFDLETNVLSTLSYNQIDHPWINIEIINNKIYNVGGNTFQEFDFNFDTLIANNAIENSIWDFGSAAQDDEIYLFGGALTSIDLNEVGKYNVEDGVVEIIGTLPLATTFCDGEVVNNKLYVLGGFQGGATSLPSSSETMVYNLENGTTELISMEHFITWTSTSVVENIIFFGGVELLDESGDGQSDNVGIYIGALETQTNEVSDIAINFDLLENERLSKLWASEDFIYLVLSQGQLDGSANLRLVRSPLN